ncbi:MAG TPA: sugar ABC transporter permease [Clostridia bacterium]|nr:sugar ABC transporter permease [Clostridia bacterium]
MSSLSLRQKSTPLMFLLPSLIIMAFILLVPIIMGLRLSFFEWLMRDISEEPIFVGLRNYIELFKSDNFRTSVSVTIRFVLSVVVIEIVAGLILALLLESGLKGMRFFRTLFVLPIMVAPVVVGVMWRFMYNPSYGKINYLLMQLGFDRVGWLSNPDIALTSVIIADVWQWTPFVFLLALAALQGIPQDLSDAAVVDGANYMQKLLRIKLPYIASILGVTAILRLIDAFRSLVVIFNLTYGGPGVSTEVMSLHLYKSAFVSQRLGLASAIAVLLLLLIVILSLGLIVSNLRNKES